MTEIVLAGENGSSITVTQLSSGHTVPCFSGVVDRMEKLPDLKVRDDDILIISFPRSGTNWVDDIVTMLVAGSTTIPGSLNVEHMLEARDHMVFDAMTSPRVMNTHLYRVLVSDSFVNGPCRKIIVRRNPKDSAVSSYHFLKKLDKFKGDWNTFIQMYQSGQQSYGLCFKHLRDWREAEKNMPPGTALALQYEEMKQDLGFHVRKIAQFLNIKENEKLYNDITTQCSFQTMVKRKQDTVPLAMIPHNVKSNIVHFGKGVVGDWKNYFTVAQNEEFDKIWEKEMCDCDLYAHLKQVSEN